MAVIFQFIKENIICDFCLVLGILAWGVTIGARISSKKSGHFVSGIPAVGGFLIIIGFLTSSVKWLAFLGLLDFDLIYIIGVIPAVIRDNIAEKRYIPPEQLENGKVVEYSLYNKCYEEIKIPREYPYAEELHTINRYIILIRDGKYFLLKIERIDKIIEEIEAETTDECRSYASKRVKWVVLEQQ
ncbi:MAG: hypothetical protein IKS48_08875 [Eubacterium sp.]|nr:hypothetical protein [Eubacterium sp.]